jgi:hypothetical protein
MGEQSRQEQCTQLRPVRPDVHGKLDERHLVEHDVKAVDLRGMRARKRSTSP